MNNNASTDGKYHLLLVYYVHDEGLRYGGGYSVPSLNMSGAVGGDTIQEMIDDTYESLEESMKDEKNIPFDIKDIKTSVALDLFECSNTKEVETAFEYQGQGITLEQLKEIILQMREDEKKGSSATSCVSK